MRYNVGWRRHRVRAVKQIGNRINPAPRKCPRSDIIVPVANLHGLAKAITAKASEVG
jgi:hypothetical protein